MLPIYAAVSDSNLILFTAIVAALILVVLVIRHFRP